jgi:integrase
MAEKLTDKIVRFLPAPKPVPETKTNAKITYDTEVAGLGCRVTCAGARAFILNYRTRSGRERRYTIGPASEWSVAAARAEAKELKKQIDRGNDPLAEIRADREAPTMADLCTRFTEEHLSKKRASTQESYGIIINGLILPKLKHMKVAEVTFADVDALHRKITKDGTPYQANRAVAVLSKMFSLAIKWQWCTANPVKGIEHNEETKRDRYLSAEELVRLGTALATCQDQQGANIIRLLLLTGARRGEVRAMRWADLNLEEGTWTKPASTTKQAKLHRVPLSAPARQLLAKLARNAEGEAEFVFPGRGGHRLDIKKTWAALCKAAGITGARVHDLRHTYASVLVSAGMSLPIIGGLLGHTQPATTARYAHLQDEPLRVATERAGAIITAAGKAGADVVQIKGGR